MKKNKQTFSASRILQAQAEKKAKNIFKLADDLWSKVELASYLKGRVSPHKIKIVAANGSEVEFSRDGLEQLVREPAGRALVRQAIEHFDRCVRF